MTTTLFMILICMPAGCQPARNSTDDIARVFAAAQRNDVAEVRAWLDARPDGVRLKDAGGRTLLHAAALARGVEALQLVLERGGDVNAADREGQTPLHAAVSVLNHGAATQLLQRRCDVQAKNGRGETALHVAASGTGDERTVADTATTKQHVPERRAGVEGRPATSDNASPAPPPSTRAELRRAIVRSLIDAGARLDAADATGATALHLAANRGHVLLLEWLVDPRVGVDPVDGRRRTPLHLAAAAGQVQVVEWLIKHGASVKARDVAGQTPLHLAAARHRTAVMQALLDAGADVDAPDSAGATPLHVVALQGPDEDEIDQAAVSVARLLLANGAAINSHTRNGATPLRCAKQAGHKRLAEFLASRDAKSK